MLQPFIFLSLSNCSSFILIWFLLRLLFNILADLFPVLIENTWCFLKTNICLFFHTSIKSIQYVIVKLYIILLRSSGFIYASRKFSTNVCFQRPCFFHTDGLWRVSYKTVCTLYSWRQINDLRRKFRRKLME